MLSKKIKTALVVLIFLLVGLTAFFIRRSLWIPQNKSGDHQLSVEMKKDQLVLFALGDTGSGDSMQYEVAQAMESRCNDLGGIDGILLLGDNFYTRGVESVDDPQWTQKVFIPYSSPCLARSVIYPVLGNHDYKGNPGAQIDYSLKNSRWTMPNRFYSVKFGKLLKIIAIDSAFPDFCLSAQSCSIDFLRAEANDQSTQWQIVTAHHPLASSSDHGFNHRGGIFGGLVKPMVCGNVDAWLSGHTHHLEHLSLESCATDLFVVGGGGGSLYELGAVDPTSQFALASHGFLMIHVDSESVNYEFISKNSKSLYSYQNKASKNLPFVGLPKS